MPYTITDNNGATSTASITIGTADGAPIAEDDTNVTTLDMPVSGDVSLNDSDANPADTLTVVNPATAVAATGPFNLTTANGGAVAFNPDGTYTYTPATGFTGEDTFSYTIADSSGKTASADVSIEVRDTTPIDPTDPTGPTNTIPVAQNDNFSVLQDTPFTSTVMGNDGDPDGDVIVIADGTGTPAAAVQTIATPNGSVDLNPDGMFTYTPNAGYIGTDTFTYTIVDPSGATDTATVELSVAPDSNPGVNDAPDANDDLLGTTKNTVSGPLVLTGNDSDLNGDTLSVTDINGTAIAVSQQST